jgi:antitoxin HicB
MQGGGQQDPERLGFEVMMSLIDVEQDTNGTLVATSKAFPELTSFGDDVEDIRRHAIGALEEVIAARIGNGERLPRPASEAAIRKHKGVAMKLPLMTALKASLYKALLESGATRAELARRLGWHREQVDRLFRIDHHSRMDRIEAAFQALGRDVDVHVARVPPARSFSHPEDAP